MPPYWVSVEGIEGVGKSYLTRLLAAQLGDRCLLLSEVTDQQAPCLTSQVITALSKAGDFWLRTGHPATETLALLAVKVHDYERLRARPGPLPEIIIEDRGIDSVALYQAAILTAPGTPPGTVHAAAERIYATARHWRPLPDRTLLLTDDPATCLARLQQRIGRPVSTEDRALIDRAGQMYDAQAAAEPARFRIIDRAGRTTAETVHDMRRACASPPMAGRHPCAT
jgi:dTMP kinase